MFITIWEKGVANSHENQSLQIEIILQGAGSNKKSLLQSTVQFQYSIFTFTVSSPQRNSSSKNPAPNQDYIYIYICAMCSLYTFNDIKHGFFWFREKILPPKKIPMVFMAFLELPRLPGSFTSNGRGIARTALKVDPWEGHARNAVKPYGSPQKKFDNPSKTYYRQFYIIDFDGASYVRC